MSGIRFERMAVLGLGLLGGSVAKAARARGVARRVVGSARRREPLERALAEGVVDEIAGPEEAVNGADLVLFGTPVTSMAPLLEQVAPHLSPGAVVTDVGSVKQMLVETLPGLLPAGVDYVGSHPMAGSHLRGVAHAREDLFEGATCVVTPHPGQSPEALASVRGLWTDLGARVVERSPVGHDEEVAWVSHLPHLLAFAFAESLSAAPAGSGELAGGGFRDFTRIARSDAELWGDILCANRKALAGPVHEVSRALAQMARVLEEGDADRLEQILASARETLAAAQAQPSSRDAAQDSSSTSEEKVRSGG